MYRSRGDHLEPAEEVEARMAAEAEDRIARFDAASRGVVTMGREPLMADPFSGPSPEALRAAEERFRSANEGRL